ncbi:hypothetical protein POTOM_003200 [Populus tomentosa]|uniref:AAA+ ATPase domain-containing protein n=1 Tax=Populus tomentosa TaxID=118781 RepID=A0A8X8DL19_POPTO|nr:hypothetical protein POTOM_003200 [Populus tomentosa]
MQQTSRDLWKMALESVGGSVISKIAELMVEPVGRQFRYMFCFNNFVEEFKERKENLALALDGLQKDVEAAERNAEEIKKGVKKWLEDAKNEIEVAKPLENEIGNNCKCVTWCPNCMRQFKLSKALAKKSETFRKLLETKFTKVADKAPPQPIEFLPSKEFTPSESSKEAFKQIMEALKDDSVNMIGLYGMGGVGKTTLVKEVGRKAKELQLFDELLMATVSQNPNVIDIQNRMADMLGLKIEEKSKEGRADRLWKRLQGKKMLIILDDVWEYIDLKGIGIPFDVDHGGCKILLTTRRQGVCSSMVCQQRVLLSPLTEKEAWDLFRINAGLPDGNTVAREVARECQGLPIALVTVGRALRDASALQWELASRQLKESQFARMEQIDGNNNAYTCLKLSYDYLKLEETKSCFVLCCLFPEDYDIPIEDLTRYAVGYGLHQDAEPIEDARKRVSVAIENLKDCCMLLGSETEEHVRMHDLVRDFAIQIASSEEYGFMVKAGLGLEKWQWTGKSFEGCTAISLMGNKLAELPEGLVCPRLKVLLLEVAYGLNVPQRFFEGMKEIEVLSLEGGCLSLQSLELSTKLQSLVLIWCKCKDLIWLRKLQRLRILGLMWCLSIEELPDEIGELKELRLLDVTGCRRLRRIPVNLIGRLKKLEELLIGDQSFHGWDVVGCDSTGGMNASLTELNSLSQLAVLSLRIPKVECIPRDFVFPVSLRKYDIIFGNRFDVGRYPSSTRLSLDGTSFNAKTFEQLFLHKLEFVKVWDCGDVFTLFPAKLQQGLKNLKEVIVGSCESLEEVFELGEADEGSSEEKEMPLLSSLTLLELSELPELKCIWKGPTRNVSLENLVHLEVSYLERLTFIFTPSLARNLPKLETLEIRDCSELKHIIREEDGEKEIIPQSPGFPKLKALYISLCFSLEYVFPVSTSPSLTNLEQMTIVRADNLKQIFYGGEGDALPRDGIIKFPRLRELSLRFRSNYIFLVPTNFDAQGHEEVGNWLAQLQQNGFLQRLEIVRMKDCGDVRAPFPAKLLQALKNPWRVEIEGCKSLEEVFELGELPDEGRSEEKELLSSSTELQLQRLPELKCIWKGPTRHASLQNLVHLSVRHLNKLTFIFTPSLAQSLPKLGSLRISKCGELKHIIREEDGERQIIQESPRLPKLETLLISGCGKLEYVFPVSGSLTLQSLPQLETLEIRDCHELKHIIRDEDGEREIIPESPCFPELKNIDISFCDKLECVSLSHNRDGIIKFPQLRELSLQLRSNYSFLGPRNFDAQLPLQRLTIKAHEEVGNWLTQLQQNGFLQRLESVHLDDCGDVRAPFPAKLLRALKNLKSVEIEDCKSLEEVFELGEADEGSSEEKELLSSLTELRLQRLPELKCIWKGPTRNVSLQSLVHLYLTSLDKLTFIFTPSLVQSLPKLAGLCIRNCGELKHIIREEDSEREIIPESPCFPKLKTIIIKECGKLEYVFPVSVSPSLLNLEEMQISDVDNLKQIFYSGEGDALTTDGIIKFPRLSELDLFSRSNYSFFGPKNFAAQLPYLQILKINGHKELGNLSAQLQQNGFLQRLEIVRMKDCGDVRAPFPAKLLQALKNPWRVEIEDCKSLEEVFELGELPDEGRSEEKELLSSLTELQLQRLPELKCIWKGPTRHLSLQSLAHLKLDYLDKLTFIFTPSLAQSLRKLERLEIRDCGELKHIIREEDGEREIIPESPRGDVRTPFPAKLLRALKNLKEVTVDSCKSLEEVFELGELPDEGRSEEKELLPSLTKLQLQRLPELKCIWKGPTRHLSLQSLAHLKLDYLDKLTFIFTPSLAQSLPKLERLYISKCGQLKHIIREEDGEREIIPESPGQDDQASPINVGKEIVLPNLKELSLEQLSSIVCFSFGWCDYFLFPRLEKLKVHQCPKLTTKFATTSDGLMSAQSKVSEVAEDSSINREWTRNNGWKEVKEEELLLRRRQCFQI